MTFWKEPDIIVHPACFYLFLMTCFSPWGSHGNSGAVAQFAEVTRHEMKWLWIVRLFVWHFVWKTKKCIEFKEAIAYLISPPRNFRLKYGHVHLCLFICHTHICVKSILYLALFMFVDLNVQVIIYKVNPNFYKAVFTGTLSEGHKHFN